MRHRTLLTLAGAAALALGRPGTCESTTNVAPSVPVVTLSASECYVGDALGFTLRATDNDNDNLYYQYTVWNASGSLLLIGPSIGPVPSGMTVGASHTFTAQGDYRIQGQAIDTYGNRGPYASKWVKVLAKPGGKGSGAAQHVKDGSAP